MPEIKKIRILSQLLFISFCGGQCTTYFLWHWPNCMLYWCRQRWNLKSSHPRFSKNVTFRLLTESSKKFLLYFLFKKEKKKLISWEQPMLQQHQQLSIVLLKPIEIQTLLQIYSLYLILPPMKLDCNAQQILQSVGPYGYVLPCTGTSDFSKVFPSH